MASVRVSDRKSRQGDAAKVLDRRGWGDGSGLKSICCSGRGPKISFQHPHGGSQPNVTPVPGVTPFWTSWALHAHGARTYTQAKLSYT